MKRTVCGVQYTSRDERRDGRGVAHNSKHPKSRKKNVSVVNLYPRVES